MITFLLLDRNINNNYKISVKFNYNCCMVRFSRT